MRGGPNIRGAWPSEAFGRAGWPLPYKDSVSPREYFETETSVGAFDVYKSRERHKRQYSEEYVSFVTFWNWAHWGFPELQHPLATGLNKL